jgi:hypothetical protein
MISTPYSDHKSFITKKTYQSSFHDQFNIEFNRINAESIDIDKNKIYDLLGKTFKSLSNQEKDKNKLLFLDELLYYSKNILTQYIETPVSNPSIRDNSFFENKFVKFNLSKSTVLKINKIARDEIKFFRGNALKGKLRRDDLQINSGVKIFRICKILNEELKDSKELKLLNEYMGYSCEVTGCSLELSHEKSTWWRNNYLGDYAPPKTLYYHFDESPKYPKAIFYLSDVSRENGCFSLSKGFNEIFEITPIQKIIGRAIQYVGKSEESKLKDIYSHKYHQTFGCKIFREHFGMLPNELKFNSHIGNDVIPNSLLELKIIENEINLTGPAGTGLIFDGSSLLHRGGLIEKGERIALQVILGKKIKFRFVNKILNKLFN